MMLVVGVRVDAATYSYARERILDWSARQESRYVCVANVHMLMEAYASAEFPSSVNTADLTVPDGVPLVWMLRLKGQRNQPRVYGPTLTLHVMDSAARDSNPVGFYGGTPKTLDSLTKRMQSCYKNLKVAYSFSPPYRALSPEEDAVI